MEKLLGGYKGTTSAEAAKLVSELVDYVYKESGIMLNRDRIDQIAMHTAKTQIEREAAGDGKFTETIFDRKNVKPDTGEDEPQG